MSAWRIADGSHPLSFDQRWRSPPPSLAAGHAGVEQVALQHRPVLGGDRDHHRRVLRALRLVHRGGVGQHQHVQLAEVVADLPSIEVDHQLAGLGIDRFHKAQIAPLNTFLSWLLAICMTLSPGAEGPAEPLDLALAGRIQWLLQLPGIQEPTWPRSPTSPPCSWCSRPCSAGSIIAPCACRTPSACWSWAFSPRCCSSCSISRSPSRTCT